MNYIIYALKEINSNELRYIGLTTGTLKSRLNRHLIDKKINHKTNWIKKIGKENIEIIIIEENIIDHKILCEKEIYYIDRYKKEGHRLTNITNGGEGWIGMKFTDKHKLNIKLNHVDVSGNKNPMYGKRHTEESLSKIRNKKIEWFKNIGFSDEHIFNMSKRVTGSGNPNSKLTEEIVIEIRSLFDTGNYTKKKLSDMYGINPPAIYKIINKLTWKNI